MTSGTDNRILTELRNTLRVDHSDTNAKALEAILSLLNDPFVRISIMELDDLIRDLETLHQETQPSAAWFQTYGALSFLAFDIAAEELGKMEWGQQLDEDEKARKQTLADIADHALVNSHTRDFIFNKYSIPAKWQDVDQLEYHKTGTTSYILRHRLKGQGSTQALKLVKYRYRENKTITEHTREYRKLYDKQYKYTPAVLDSDGRFILMTFQEGLTFEEFIGLKMQSGKMSNRATEKLGTEICDILEYFAKEGRHHGDLNPRNIIIEELSDEDWNVSLVDFGVNYLLNERVGSSGELARLGIYVAPEVIEDSTQLSYLSDVYSLGVLAVRLLSNEDRPFDHREFEMCLDAIRLEDPTAGALLDDMLSRNPKYRLFCDQRECRSQQDPAPMVYENLRTSIGLMFKLRRARASKSNRSLNGIVARVLSVASGDIEGLLPAAVAEESAAADELQGERWKGCSNFRWLTRNLADWSKVAGLMHVVVVLAFMWAFQLYHSKGELADALPGLLVCLSFSFVAVRYYIEILGRLDTSELGSSGRRVNLWLRFGAVYWPAPILTVYALNPAYWPLACAFGTSVVAIINRECYRLANEAQEPINVTFGERVSKSVVDRLTEFKGWWEQMALFSLAILLLGLLMLAGWLKDYWAYVVIVILVNVKLWRNNSGLNAPGVRQMLQYFFQRYAKAREIRNESKAAQAV